MSFYSTRDVKSSRKRRVCDECGHHIEIGEPYRAYAQLFDGEFYNGSVHADCQRWANAVMCCDDDGRAFLRDGDPADEYELADDVRANPPPPAVYARLPARWRKAVDDILKGAEPLSERLL